MKSSSSNQTDNHYKWPLLLAQAIAKNIIGLIFVFATLIVFRMPHLSDLTVVIIQLEDSHWKIMIAFYISIYVMALLISYGNLVHLESTYEIKREGVQNRQSKIVRHLSTFIALIKAISIKDPEEKRLQNSDSGKAESDESQNNELYVELIFPKLLAIFMLLGIAFSVESTYYELFNTHIVPSKTFLALTILLIAVSHPKIGNYLVAKLHWDKKNGWIPMILVAISFLLIVIFGFQNSYGTQNDIRNLFWSLICLSLIFTLFSLTYNQRIFDLKNKFAFPIAVSLILFAFGSYLVMLFDPRLFWLKKLTPVVILMICLIGIFALILTIKYVGRIIKFPLLTVVIMTFLILGFTNAKRENFNHYEVSNVPSKIDSDDRLNLDVFINQWLDQREALIDSSSIDKPFPIVMVSAEGGGSRAGHWAFLVHSYLYSLNKGYYNNHLFSLTGASGGSIGSNIFYALAHKNKDKFKEGLFLTKKGQEQFGSLKSEYTDEVLYKASLFYNEDYISSSLAGLMGRDLFASIFNLKGLSDCGDITEFEWEETLDSVFKENLLKRPYSDKMIKRSSGMLLTARFPYLSPNGRITGVGQFGDGGYYDNIGSVVTKCLEKTLNEVLDQRKHLKGKYKIRHLIIRNNTDPQKRESDKNEFSDTSVDYYC